MTQLVTERSLGWAGNWSHPALAVGVIKLVTMATQKMEEKLISDRQSLSSNMFD